MEELKDLVIEKTAKTPQIELSAQKGEISFTGKSLPENASRLFEPVLNWVEKYALKPRPITNLRMGLEYFNTSTTLWLSKIIQALTRINNPDYMLFVHVYMSVDEFDDLRESSDIRDAFNPVTEILQHSIPEVSLKLYATDDTSHVIRDALVLF
jgi:hypothetical protein